MSYNLGDVVPLSITVTDSSGAPANAGSVTVTIGLPDGTSSTSSPISPASTGVYNYDYPTVQAGRHTVRWVATGANASAFTDMFEVLPAVSNLLVSLADIKDQLNIDSSNTTSDAELLEFGRAATKICEDYVGSIVRTAYTESLDGGRCELLLSHPPVLSVSQVTENGTVLAASAYSLLPRSGVLGRTDGAALIPFEPGVRNIVVAYVAGATSTPPNVRQAALIIVQHLWETQRPAARGAFSQGSDDFDPRYSFSIPRRALELLGEPVGGIA